MTQVLRLSEVQLRVCLGRVGLGRRMTRYNRMTAGSRSPAWRLVRMLPGGLGFRG